MRFKIDWASLIVGSKFTVSALSYFVFEGIFQVQATRGSFHLKGRFNGGFFALPVWGVIFGGACFRNFTIFYKNIRLVIYKLFECSPNIPSGLSLR